MQLLHVRNAIGRTTHARNPPNNTRIMNNFHVRNWGSISYRSLLKLLSKHFRVLLRQTSLLPQSHSLSMMKRAVASCAEEVPLGTNFALMKYMSSLTQTSERAKWEETPSTCAHRSIPKCMTPKYKIVLFEGMILGSRQNDCNCRTGFQQIILGTMFQIFSISINICVAVGHLDPWMNIFRIPLLNAKHQLCNANFAATHLPSARFSGGHTVDCIDMAKQNFQFWSFRLETQTQRINQCVSHPGKLQPRGQWLPIHQMQPRKNQN